MFGLWPKKPRTLGVAFGAMALQVAREHIGRGEACDHIGKNGLPLHSNNCGPDVRYYRADAVRAAWCAAAVYTWFLEGATRNGFELPFKRSHSARRLAARMEKFGRLVTVPSPGDVVLWARPPNPFSGHLDIVESVALDRSGRFNTIDGNIGKHARVAIFPHVLGEPRLLKIIRV